MVRMFSGPGVDDLRLVQSQAVPRDDVVARRIAARVSPSGGFFLYGLLYFLGPAFAIYVAALLVAVFGFAHGLDQVPIPPWAVMVSVVGAGVPFALSWWPYGAWVRRRRADGWRLGREGMLQDAVVVRCSHRRAQGWPITSATVEFGPPGARQWAELSVGTHRAELREGASLTALVHPEGRCCGVFIVGGLLCPAVKRRPRVDARRRQE